MELWNETQWYVPVIYNVLLIAIPTLAGLAVASETGILTIKSFKRFWQTIRPALDQPTDPAIIYLARLTGKTEEQISEFLITSGDKVVELLPQETVK